MQDEDRSSVHLKLNKSLENCEVKSRLLTFLEVLKQINEREKIVQTSYNKQKESNGKNP